MTMQHPLRRGVTAALASVALLVGSTLAAAPAQAEPEPIAGTLTIKIVDEHGRPTPAGIQAGTADGAFWFSLPTYGGEEEQVNRPESTYTVETGPGRYGFVAMPVWGGLTCAGVAPCDATYFNGGEAEEPTVTGVVDVIAGQEAVYTLTVPAAATISGTHRVGRVLTAKVSDAQHAMTETFAQDDIYGLLMGSYQMQWRRDGVAIPGATGPAYELTERDATRTIDVAVNYPDLMRAFMRQALGFLPEAYVVPGVRVPKVATRTTSNLLRKRIFAGRNASIRVDVTAGRASVTGGKVQIAVGKRKVTRPVRNGSARAALAGNLRPGNYRVTVRYLGSKIHQASKARNLKLRIVRK